MDTHTFSSTVNNWMQAIAILIAGIWIASVWSYQNIYLPSTSEPHVEFNVDVEHFEVCDDLVAVRFSVILRNDSEVRAYQAANAYHVYGYTAQLSDEPMSDEEFGQFVVNGLSNRRGRPTTYRRLFDWKNRVWLAFGTFTTNTAVIEPNEEVFSDILVFAPRTVDVVHLSAFASYTKDKTDYIPEWAYSPPGRVQRTAGVAEGLQSSVEVMFPVARAVKSSGHGEELDSSRSWKELAG